MTHKIINQRLDLLTHMLVSIGVIVGAIVLTVVVALLQRLKT